MSLEQSTILITGGTGMLGYGLVRQLLPYNPAKIIVFSRNEASQVAMSRAIADRRLSFCIGDVRDKAAISKACEGVDAIFHLAELKDVQVCEDQPDEAIKTNISGTSHVIEAALEKAVKKVIYWSSDKAAMPSSIYGLTKAIGEKLTIHANTLKAGTALVCVRGGSIFEALCGPQARHAGEAPASRYYVPLEHASRMLIKAALAGKGGELFVVASPLFQSADLAKAIAGDAKHSGAAGKDTGSSEAKAADGSAEQGTPEAAEREMLVSEYDLPETSAYDNELFIIFPPLLPELKQAYAEAAAAVKTSVVWPADLTAEQVKERVVALKR